MLESVVEEKNVHGPPRKDLPTRGGAGLAHDHRNSREGPGDQHRPPPPPPRGPRPSPPAGEAEKPERSPRSKEPAAPWRPRRGSPFRLAARERRQDGVRVRLRGAAERLEQILPAPAGLPGDGGSRGEPPQPALEFSLP